MPTNHQTFYSWRRMQLSEMDQKTVDAIVDPAIGTAEAILNHPHLNPSAILKGTTAKYLIDTMGKVAGYKGAPMRKMQNLLKRLSAGHGVLHAMPLHPLGPLDELIEVAEAASRIFPYLRQEEAQPIANRILKRWDMLCPMIPPEHKRLHKCFQRNDPTYVEQPNVFAQFQEYKTLPEQLDKMNREHRYKQALKLLNISPAGHA